MTDRRTVLSWGAAAATAALGTEPADASDGPLPTVCPVPGRIDGVEHVVTSLAGAWYLSTEPPDEFWSDDVEPAGWDRVQVPGEPAMQGISVPRDREFAYKTLITVPDEYRDHRVILRFDAVYSDARVWIGGTHVRDHRGGFTSWQADVTDLVRPGGQHWLTVGVIDRWQDLSYGSYYARHQIGGILRDVRLICLPPDHLAAVSTATTFDEEFRHATLHLDLVPRFHDRATLPVRLRLRDPAGKQVPIQQDLVELDGPRRLELPVHEPLQWNAEHPHLYTLELTLGDDDRATTIEQRVGFRQVSVRGTRLLLNGQPIKLRGVCRHEVSPTGGRGATAQLADADVQAFKAANVNLIRTSHYPPDEALLEAADRHGMYIEEETAVCWVNQQGHDDSLEDESTTADWLGQLAEMVQRDRNHPSVLIWSLANENIGWGRNPQAQWDYLEENEPSRPVVYSHSNTWTEGAEYDLGTKHYPLLGKPLGGTGEPWLYDEFAHLPAYNLDDLRNDPGVRAFWGEGISRFWAEFQAAPDVVGGAIWGGIDEVFELPQGPSGTAEWGLLDIWRRPKPEYWLTKKAYSPIRVADEPIIDYRMGSPLTIPVRNWFDFTDLSELTVRWRIGAAAGDQSCPQVAPGSSGVLSIPYLQAQHGQVLELEFLNRSEELVDSYALPIGRRDARPLPVPSGPAPQLQCGESYVLVNGGPVTLKFSESTGQLIDGRYGNTRVLSGGPDLHLRQASLGTWRLESMDVAADGPSTTTVTVVGSYGDLRVTMRTTLSGDGLIIASYEIHTPPADQPPAGYNELGLTFRLPPELDRLAWQCRSQWSVYPDDHIARPAGTATARPAHAAHVYRTRPEWPWSQDTHDFFLRGKDDPGRDCHDFRALRTGVEKLALTTADGTGVLLESDGSVAARVDQTPPAWIGGSHPSVNWLGDSAEFTFEGTGVEWIGGRGPELGLVDVYLDGQKDATVDQYHAVDVHQQITYRRTGLAAGPHSIKLVVTGRKNPASSTVLPSIDAFRVLPDADPSRSLYVDVKWNYPNYGYGGADYSRTAVRIAPRETGRATLRLGNFPQI